MSTSKIKSDVPVIPVKAITSQYSGDLNDLTSPCVSLVHNATNMPVNETGVYLIMVLAGDKAVNLGWSDDFIPTIQFFMLDRAAIYVRHKYGSVWQAWKLITYNP